MTSTVSKMTPQEREHVIYVRAFMYAEGIEVLRVDDENEIPSYAVDYPTWEDEYEELHHSVAWLPQGLGLINNSTPGGGWNPEVRREDLDRVLNEIEG